MKAKPADYGKTLRVNRSAKHGRGVYATAPIPRAAKVIEYVGKLVPVKDSDGIAEKQMTRAGKSGTGHVYLFTLNKRYDIDGNVPWNKARLINHSCDPNVFFDTTKMEVVCLKHIQPGEEFRFFYPSTEWEMSQPFVCNCGSSNCLQLISGAAQLSDDTLAKYRLSDFIAKQVQHRL